jgi:hypothetical protein
MAGCSGAGMPESRGSAEVMPALWHRLRTARRCHRRKRTAASGHAPHKKPACNLALPAGLLLPHVGMRGHRAFRHATCTLHRKTGFDERPAQATHCRSTRLRTGPRISATARRARRFSSGKPRPMRSRHVYGGRHAPSGCRAAAAPRVSGRVWLPASPAGDVAVPARRRLPRWIMAANGWPPPTYPVNCPVPALRARKRENPPRDRQMAEPAQIQARRVPIGYTLMRRNGRCDIPPWSSHRPCCTAQ